MKPTHSKQEIRERPHQKIMGTSPLLPLPGSMRTIFSKIRNPNISVIY